MAKRGYLPRESRFLKSLVEQYGNDREAWTKIANNYNKKFTDYPRTAIALRAEFGRRSRRPRRSIKDRTIERIRKELTVVEVRLMRRTIDAGVMASLRQEVRELKKRNIALEAALRPFRKAYDRSRKAMVEHSERAR